MEFSWTCVWSGKRFGSRKWQMGELFGRERSVITKHVHTCSGRGNETPSQYVQILHVLPRTAKRTSRISIEIAE